jgi:hypothetical protein
MSHQLTAVLCIGCFYVLGRINRGELSERWYLLAGAFAGIIPMCEYTGALTVLALLFYAVLSAWKSPGDRARQLAKSAAMATVGALPFILALMAYHQACFGGPLESGYRHLADVGYQAWHVGGFLGIGLPDTRAFVLSFFSPLRGLFVMSPFLLLSLGGLPLLKQLDRPLFWLSAALLLMNAYFTSSFSYDSWGWSSGPRHLTPLIPFMLLPAGLAVRWLSEQRSSLGRLGYGAAVGLCVVSVLISGTVAMVNYVMPDVTTSFWGLSLPLLRQGYQVPSVFLFLGIPNPLSGAIIWGLVLAETALLGVLFLWLGAHGRGRLLAGAGCVAAAVLVLGALRLATNVEGDQGGVKFLEGGWLAPPGARVAFFPWQR